MSNPVSNPIRRLLRCALLAATALAATLGVVQAQPAVLARMGDLTIEGTVRSGSSFNLNYGRVKQSTAGFRVMHKGKPVGLRDDKGVFSELVFWDAWTLPDAPRPAVFAANRGSYLITVEGDQVRVQQLRGAFHDAASWQWLDAGGQVGERHSVYIADSISGPRELRGGTVLAVSDRSLLDVKTLQLHPMSLSGEFEQLKQNNGYSVGDRPILMYSAQARQLAALGDNVAGTFAVGSKDNPEFAMVVLDLASGRQYSLPFDRNAMRLAEPLVDATPAWAARHFEWRTDAQGGLRLQARKLAKPYPWMGRFRDLPREGDSRNTSYLLMPADERMLAPLIALIERDFGGKQVPLVKDEAPGSKIRMEVNALPISLQLRDADGGIPSAVEIITDVPVTSKLAAGSSWKLEFSYEPEKIRATNLQLVKIGQHIDRELAQGKLQAHFTTIPRKRD